MSKSRARRIMELLYFHAWGPQGHCTLRDEWHVLYKYFQRKYKVGIFSRNERGIRWSSPKAFCSKCRPKI